MGRNKFKAKKVRFNGMVFDSQHEYEEWSRLRLLERAGIIHDLRRQVKYVLIPAQYEQPEGGKKRGKLLEREVAYYADMVYTDCDGKLVVIDAKGVRTKDYIIKRKLMLLLKGIRIVEV